MQMVGPGYSISVPWSVRFTWSGDYYHDAYWSVGEQGFENVSHGCVNLSPADAEIYYNLAIPGDPITIVGSPKPGSWDDGYTEWFLSWAQYLQGSALHEAVLAGPGGSAFVDPSSLPDRPLARRSKLRPRTTQPRNNRATVGPSTQRRQRLGSVTPPTALRCSGRQNGVVPPLALFDLDNTLVDRQAVFGSWADWFVSDRAIDPVAVEYLRSADRDGFAQRVEIFEELRERFGLEESVEDLVVAYWVEYLSFYRPDPEVISAVTRLRGAGWRVGIVTNGSSTQREKVTPPGSQALSTLAVCQRR